MSKVLMNRMTTFAKNNTPELLTSDYGRANYVNWGKRNDYPTELFKMYSTSGFHRAIIDSRVNMILGDGVVQDDTLPFSNNTQRFLDKPNKYGNFDDMFKKLTYDFEIFGIAYIEIIFSNDRMSISSIDQIDSSKIRWGKKTGNRLTHVYYSDNWSKSSSEKTPIVIFNSDLKTEHPRQVLPIVRYTPSIDYYTLPSYSSVLKWIHIDYLISNFHENNILNGFTPTIFFGFPMGQPTEDEQETIERKLKQKYAGTDNAGSVITAFYEPGTDNEVKIEVLEISDADKQFEWLKKTTQEEILIGHKVTNPALVGIATEGKLGGTSGNELLISHEMYYNDIIRPEQDYLLSAINKILAYNGMNNVKILDNKPLSQQFGENILTQILTKDELRDIIGYSALEVTEEEEVVVDDKDVATNLSCNCGKEHNHEEEVIYKKYADVDLGDEMEFDGKTIKLRGEMITSATPNRVIKNIFRQKHQYIWTLGKGGKSKKNCPACIKWAGEVRTLKDWRTKAVPGKSSSEINGSFATLPYGTFCEADCTCKLIRID